MEMNSWGTVVDNGCSGDSKWPFKEPFKEQKAELLTSIPSESKYLASWATLSEQELSWATYKIYYKFKYPLFFILHLWSCGVTLLFVQGSIWPVVGTYLICMVSHSQILLACRNCTGILLWFVEPPKIIMDGMNGNPQKSNSCSFSEMENLLIMKCLLLLQVLTGFSQSKKWLT